jgi:hypothetical protein
MSGALVSCSQPDSDIRWRRSTSIRGGLPVEHALAALRPKARLTHYDMLPFPLSLLLHILVRVLVRLIAVRHAAVHISLVQHGLYRGQSGAILARLQHNTIQHNTTYAGQMRTQCHAFMCIQTIGQADKRMRWSLLDAGGIVAGSAIGRTACYHQHARRCCRHYHRRHFVVL